VVGGSIVRFATAQATKPAKVPLAMESKEVMSRHQLPLGKARPVPSDFDWGRGAGWLVPACVRPAWAQS